MCYFTVFIPTYNRAYILERNLNSLDLQTFCDFEVLIVDDGSTDNTRELIDTYKKNHGLNIRYIYKENGGKHSALNIGFKEAKGMFFLVVDSDDWLCSRALETLYGYCKLIENKKSFSGVMLQYVDYATNRNVGNFFPTDLYISSYFDFHFVNGRKYDFGDCCECNKTEVLKKYSFPEDMNTKFIPEAYVFDQIGMEYNMLCGNEQIGFKEMQADGISKNVMYKYENYVGFLYHYVSRIDTVFSKNDVALSERIIAWWRYWQMLKLDKEKKGPRCKRISLLGLLVFMGGPVINLIYKIKYRDLYERGR